MENTTIRPLTENDLVQVVFLDDESGNWVSQWLEDNEDYVWGLFQGIKLIGYCTIGYADDCPREIREYPGWTYDSLLLSDVFILPEYRHQGYATKIIRDVLNARNQEPKELVFLTLLYDDLTRVYEKHGFKLVGNGVMVLDPTQNT